MGLTINLKNYVKYDIIYIDIEDFLIFEFKRINKKEGKKMKTTFLFAEKKSLEGLVKTLKDENLENAQVFIGTEFIEDLAQSADRDCTVKDKIKEIIWEPKSFIDYEIKASEYGHRVYRINMGEKKNLFFDRINQFPSQIIVIQ